MKAYLLLTFTERRVVMSKSVIKTGRSKKTGGHDHRGNRGDDRTPSQKSGDKSRKN